MTVPFGLWGRALGLSRARCAGGGLVRGGSAVRRVRGSAGLADRSGGGCDCSWWARDGRWGRRGAGAGCVRRVRGAGHRGIEGAVPAARREACGIPAAAFLRRTRILGWRKAAGVRRQRRSSQLCRDLDTEQSGLQADGSQRWRLSRPPRRCPSAEGAAGDPSSRAPGEGGGSVSEGPGGRKSRHGLR